MEKKSILIVEDEVIIAENIKKHLQKNGYNVLGIITMGEDALEALPLLKPDIVLLDIKLEGSMDGIQVAEIIRQQYQIPVIFLTSYGDDATLSQAILSEPFGYILKPFDERELVINIEMAFYKHRMEQKLRDNERFLRQIINSVPDSIFVKDRQGKYLLANESFAGMLDLPVAELEAKTDRELAGLGNLQEDDLLAYTGGNSYPPASEPQIFRLRKNDQDRWYRRISLPVTNGKGKNMLSVVIDITDSKRSEANLEMSLQKMQKLFTDTVNGLVSAAEMRDPYTAGHQRRVASLATAIAREMQLSADQLDGIRLSALIHDIGKILIPPEILSKPGKLSEMEFKLVQFHSQAGYDILKNIDFPWPVADIVLQHHERLDGSGYPAGLKGDNIMLEARIICLADVVEAMASHRPYRPALGMEAALREINTFQGIFFDQRAVQICNKLYEQGNLTFD